MRTFPGEWCDVDHAPGRGFIFARLERNASGGVLWVHREPNIAVVAQGIALGRWGLYLRAAADGAGNVCAVLQDGRDPPVHPAIVVICPADGSPPREIACPSGPAFGQNAVEVVREKGGWIVYVVQAADRVWANALDSDGTWGWARIVHWAPTSQGFADAPLRMDDVRTSVPGMVCPSSVDGLSIGQNADDGPDRIRGLDGTLYFTAIPGTGFEPHLASDGAGRWMGCARTPQGATLAELTRPFEPDQPAPEPLPDQPFVVDPTGVVDDISAWLFAPNQPGIAFSPDGTVRWFCKSDEGSGDGPNQIGEWWDRRDGYIGHLEDSSMGRRIYNGKAVSPEQLAQLVPPDQLAAVWASLPLYRNWWKDGARVWLPERCVSGSVLAYTTDFLFNTGEVHPNVLIEIRVDVGHGVIHGKTVRVRGSYNSSPDGGRTWNMECNYYGEPSGYNAWIAGPFATDGPEWMPR